MPDFRSPLQRLLAVIPAILLLTFMHVFIMSAVSGVVMLELQAAYPGSRWPLGVAILTAVIVLTWMNFNHKLRAYIKNQGTEDEQ
jgi:uncharacterized integral membrane protein